MKKKGAKKFKLFKDEGRTRHGDKFARKAT